MKTIKVLFALWCVLGAAAAMHAEVKRAVWGRMPDATPVHIFTLRNGNVEARVTEYGARIVSLRTPDRNGVMADVVLGYDTLQQYIDDGNSYLGAVVGRYGNRIAASTFSLDGKTYHLSSNEKGNTLHGGAIGFDKKVWKGHEIAGGVEFTLISPDGDMGFPGKLTATVRYTLDGNALHIGYMASTNKPTVVNLTNHSFFNLGGNDEGDILGESLMINADRFTPSNSQLIPTGAKAPVAGTPLDFRKATVIGARIREPYDALKSAGGYDLNYILNTVGGPAASVFDPRSGRTMTVTTSEPGLQFYSANHLSGEHTGRHGTKYGMYSGLCLETQHFPDSPNEPAYPSTVLRPGTTFHSETVFTFTAR